MPASDQPWYTNAVAEANTGHDAFKTLSILQEVEMSFGRQRTIANASRVLDLDLLDFGGKVISTKHLILPHPRLHERAFVLKPLSDLIDDWVHPITGIQIGRLIEQLPEDQIIRHSE